jgi:hypothetical protein
MSASIFGRERLVLVCTTALSVQVCNDSVLKPVKYYEGIIGMVYMPVCKSLEDIYLNMCASQRTINADVSKSSFQCNILGLKVNQLHWPNTMYIYSG